MGGANVTICISGSLPGVGDHSSWNRTPWPSSSALLTAGILKWLAYFESLRMQAPRQPERRTEPGTCVAMSVSYREDETL